MTPSEPGAAADAAPARSRTPVHQSVPLIVDACLPLAPWVALVASLVAAKCGVAVPLCLAVASGALAAVAPHRGTNGVRQ